MTNSHGAYMGDASLDPVYPKLNARRAVIFMHPTQCHTSKHPEIEKKLDEYPAPMVEFVVDTVRAVANLLMAGTPSRRQI